MATATFTCASSVEAARCGVSVTFSTPKSGCSFSGGSVAYTSRAAPAISLEVSASWSAASSTTPPRDVLMTRAVFFIFLN